jgi:G3E family GTPase
MSLTSISNIPFTGKTTLLTRILANTKHLRVGCIVNDLASLNIDAAIVSGGEGAPKIAALQNGCLCCDGSAELVKSLISVIQASESGEKKLDHLVIEATGVAEPERVRVKLMRAAQSGAFSKLDAEPSMSQGRVVTVVDSSMFSQNLHLGHRPAQAKGQVRPLSELLLAQVEEADVVILNKSDLISDERQMDRVREAVSALRRKRGSSKVDILTSERCTVSVEDILSKSSNDNKQQEQQEQHEPASVHRHHDAPAKKSCGCDHQHHCSHASEANRAASHFAIHHYTFVSSPGGEGSDTINHRPFVRAVLEERILKLLPSARQAMNWEDWRNDRHASAGGDGAGSSVVTLARVLSSCVRSKGFVWLEEDPDAAYLWSHAGTHSELSRHGPWQTTAATATETTELDEAALRRQGLVFIGVGLEGEAVQLLEKELRACLAPGAAPASDGSSGTRTKAGGTR